MDNETPPLSKAEVLERYTQALRRPDVPPEEIRAIDQQWVLLVPLAREEVA